MAPATSTLAINAAFLQEIKDDNLRLRELFVQAETSRHGQVGKFADVLSALRDQLAMHFALEEAYGYFDDAVTEAPRLSTRASRLRDEHRELFTGLCRLLDQVEHARLRHGKHRVPAKIEQVFTEFHQAFQRHESDENALILEAFNDDIGTGD